MDASANFAMRYLVKARMKKAQAEALARTIADGTPGHGSIAGYDYLYDMKIARVDAKGDAHWVETCFCDPPLAEERPYWKEYFELLSVTDAHSLHDCRHENGAEAFAVATVIAKQRQTNNFAASPSEHPSIFLLAEHKDSPRASAAPIFFSLG